MHTPLGVVYKTVYFSPAVTAAVYSVALGVTDCPADIGEGCSVAVAVTLAVNKNIVRADHRPVVLAVRRIMTDALQVITLD